MDLVNLSLCGKGMNIFHHIIRQHFVYLQSTCRGKKQGHLGSVELKYVHGLMVVEQSQPGDVVIDASENEFLKTMRWQEVQSPQEKEANQAENIIWHKKVIKNVTFVQIEIVFDNLSTFFSSMEEVVCLFYWDF